MGATEQIINLERKSLNTSTGTLLPEISPEVSQMIAGNTKQPREAIPKGLQSMARDEESPRDVITGASLPVSSDEYPAKLESSDATKNDTSNLNVASSSVNKANFNEDGTLSDDKNLSTKTALAGITQDGSKENTDKVVTKADLGFDALRSNFKEAAREHEKTIARLKITEAKLKASEEKRLASEAKERAATQALAEVNSKVNALRSDFKYLMDQKIELESLIGRLFDMEDKLEASEEKRRASEARLLATTQAVNDAVIQVIRAMGANNDAGVHVDQITQHVIAQGYSAGVIKVIEEAINHLSNEGRIYSTIDENTFMYAE